MSLSRPQKISLLIFGGAIVAVPIALIFYDLWAASTHRDATISWSMSLLAARYPIIAFAWGFFVGAFGVGLGIHFFWPMESPIDFAEMQRLQAENVKLAAGNASLEAEVDRLRDRVATLMVGGDRGEL